MTTLYAITPLANSDVEVAKYSHEIDPEPISKNDVTPTTNNQQHNLNNKKTEPSSIQQEPIDNIQKKDYYQTNADTKPVNKIDIQGSNSSDVDNVNTKINNGDITPVDNNPITKDEIDQTTDDNIDIQNNKLTNTYNDMMSRMNNLYNDNNNEEEL